MRIRSVWPQFWVSLTLAELPREVRLAFIALWNYADDEGRERLDYRLLKGALFPLDEDVTLEVLEKWVSEMAKQGLLILYSDAKGKPLYSIRSWKEYQHPNKPKKSAFPAPPKERNGSGTYEEGTRNVALPVGREGKGVERNGKEERRGPTALKDSLQTFTDGLRG